MNYKVLFMIRISFRIYLLSNLALIMFLLPLWADSMDDIYFLFIGSLFSLLITIPVVRSLFLVFWLVDNLPANIIFKWGVFLLLIAACACIPTLVIEFPRLVLDPSLMQISMPAAFIGVLFQAIPIHQYLINANGKENTETL